MHKMLCLYLILILCVYTSYSIQYAITCLQKNEDDIFILSNGHAAYALYVVLEKYYNHINADDLATRHKAHPNWEEKNHIYCSTGSLGMGILVAVGRAIAKPSRKIYVMISDGECAEGSVWEALRYIQEKNIKNIEVHVNANGYTCYDHLDIHYLEKRLKAFMPDIIFHKTTVSHFPFLKGINAHYMKISKDQYEEGIKQLNETTVK